MDVTTRVRRLRERREQAAARRAADAELVRATPPSPRLAWRTNELLASEHRRALAESLADLVHASETRYLPNASPLNRAAVRRELDVLLALAARLADTTRPVRPRGVLLVERLLTSTRSPIFARGDADDLRATVLAASAALETER
jgi:hypothetical protein